MYRTKHYILLFFLLVVPVLAHAQYKQGNPSMKVGSKPEFWIVPVAEIAGKQGDSQEKMAADIARWIEQNKTTYTQILRQPGNYAKISHVDFYSFRPEQRAAFKELSKSHEVLLEPQKEIQKKYFTVPPPANLKPGQSPPTRRVFLMPQGLYLHWKAKLGL
jgi:hypothetical protein